MIKLSLKDRSAQRIRQGERLIQPLDLADRLDTQALKDGQILRLFDGEGHFVASALVGWQNKGIGWVYSQDPEESWGPALIEDRLRRAIDRRRPLFNDSQTTAFRLLNGEGDGLGGLTIDYYQGFLQLNWYSRGIYQSQATIVDLFQQLLGSKFLGIYETLRFEVAADEAPIRHLAGQLAPQPLHILENGIHYAVYLGQEWMTGIFLDQRQVRDFVMTQAQGLKVLNLFSYTAAFSVAAAVGQAERTVSVDVANRSLERSQEQFRLNGIEPDQSDHELVVMDVFDYINYCKRHQQTFDLIICDPPSFARTKKRTFSARQDYGDLAQDLFDLTAPQGMCILTTNHSAYSRQAFQQDMVALGQAHPGNFQLIQSFSLGEDFPTTADEMSDYLKVLVFYRTT